MIVTINTDASFHSTYNVGSFAYKIVCNQGTIRRYGAFRTKTINSLDAEIKSICNALHSVLSENFTDVFLIVINTDCTNAIQAITGKGKYKNIGKKYESTKKAKDFINRLKQKYKKVRIDFRHVKAHTELTAGSPARNFVNDWCDITAKAELWRYIHSNNLISKYDESETGK